MKIIFEALAAYNRSVNESVRKILTGLSQEQMKAETKAFYHSLYDTYLHLVLADVYWLKRYRSSFPDNSCLKNNEILIKEMKAIFKEIENEYQKLFQIQKDVDVLIEQFIDSLTDKDREQVIQYKDSKKESVEKPVWQMLLHWFNHQTHHRGQISVQLDLLGIDNDFSAMITRI